MMFAGVWLTHATVIKPVCGKQISDWEYVIWALGTGILK